MTYAPTNSIMKKVYVLLLAAGLMLISSQEAVAQKEFSKTKKQKTEQKFKVKKNKTNRGNPNPGAVGAPLDGGLLAILAAAGGAYFIARKKKKNKQEG